MLLTNWLWDRTCWIIQRSENFKFEWSKEPKMSFLAIFLSLVHRIDLILHILMELFGVHHLGIISAMLDHSKISKMPFWMIQIAKNEVLGHFLEFAASEWLDIAHFDRTYWSGWFGHGITHAGVKLESMNKSQEHNLSLQRLSSEWIM